MSEEHMDEVKIGKVRGVGHLWSGCQRGGFKLYKLINSIHIPKHPLLEINSN